MNVKHKPLKAQAVQVEKSSRDVKKIIPRSHGTNLPSGRLAYVHLVDAEGQTKAYPGNWVLKFEDGTVEILTDDEFTRRYEQDGD